MRDFVVAYDASCGPCTRFRRALEFFDIFQRIGFVSLDEANREGRLDNVPEHLRFRSFHMILPNGDILSGSDALPSLMGLLPAGGLVSRLMMSTPLGPKIASSVYSAASRLHESESCASPGAVQRV